jgi:hypothetical protein
MFYLELWKGLEENIGEALQDIGTGNNFLDRTQETNHKKQKQKLTNEIASD